MIKKMKRRNRKLTTPNRPLTLHLGDLPRDTKSLNSNKQTRLTFEPDWATECWSSDSDD